MEFRHLRYFVAVVEERQFVRAAAELHVAQSALSQQIRDLERELGAELLYRDRRGVTPTPAGEVLLDHARRLLAGEERARAEVAQLTGLVTGRLSVGFGSPTGPIPMLIEFQRRHPQVQIALRDAPSDELARQLLDGSLDVALLSYGVEHLPRRLEATVITHERLVVLVPATHCLARRPSVTLTDLADEPIVAWTRGSGMRDTIDDGFRARGLSRPPVSAETIDPFAILELVGGGLGCSIVPTSIAEHAGRDIRVLDLEDPELVRTISIAWIPDRRALPALDAFLDLAADWIPGPDAETAA
jgi:LysR family transcriptional activator of glutamate synthase operon